MESLQDIVLPLGAPDLAATNLIVSSGKLLAVLRLEVVANGIGRSRASVWAYRTGDRVPPPEVQRAPAFYLRDHAGLLAKMADDLDAAT